MESVKIKTSGETASEITQISVVGIGGAGCNAIYKLRDIEKPYLNTIAIDTDEMSLSQCKVKTKILIGEKITEGRGSGGKPEIGERAAKESETAIKEAIKDSGIVLLIAGLGSGTGSGASYVAAQIAKELDILTIVVYTMPFEFEGQNKLSKAQKAADNISKIADAWLPIDNKMMFRILPKDISAKDAYNLIDDIIRNWIMCILSKAIDGNRSLTSYDLFDLILVLKNSGKFFFGAGTSTIQEGVMLAYKRAVNNMFLDYSIENATKLIIHINGHENTPLDEIKEVYNSIKEKANEDVVFLCSWSVKEDGDFLVSITASFK